LPQRALAVQATHFVAAGRLIATISISIPRLPENPKNPLAKRRDPDSTERMIRPGFLDRESRQDLIELARNGSAAHRLARRANALVLLDDGMSTEAIAKVLLLDDDTIRTWYRLYEEDRIEGLTNFGYGASCRDTSRTTSATQLAPNSPMRRSVFCEKKFPGIGPTYVIRSPTTSASSIQRIFGL